jgi:ABC-type antimicrobial peptide transport system permease subunit
VPSALAQPMLERFPEIQEITRVFRGEAVFESGETKFSETGIYADSSLLSMFSFPLKEGKLEHILSGVQSVVISERLAEKYFPGESALGKNISIVDKEKLNYVVTGVLEEIPTQSSLQCDFVLSYDQFETKQRPWWNGKTNVHAFTNFNVEAYASLVPGVDPIQLNGKLQTFIHDYTSLETTDALFVFPFTEYYLHSDFSNGRIPTGKIQYVKLLSVIAFIVLLIACINFMNLSTARAGTRVKEVGVRKIIGAPRFQLLFQFIAESFVITVIAMVISVTLYNILLPAINLITQKQI